MKKYILFLVSAVAISNHKSVSHFLNLMTNDYTSSRQYLYSNGSGSFFISNIYLKSTHDNDLGFDQASYLYKQYQVKHKDDTTALYRNFKIYPWKVWNWRRYLFSKGYRLPYKREIPPEYRVSRSYNVGR